MEKNWTLNRFSAIDIHYVNKHKIPGSLRANEKACFLSHRQLIKNNITSKDPILFLEDDAIIGQQTCTILNQILQHHGDFEWDIIYTDVCIHQPDTMIDMINLRKDLKLQQKTQLLNLNNFSFAGATSYIINPLSLIKVDRLLSQEESLDVPYDIYLRTLVEKDILKGYVVFPFITTLSNDSEESQIQLTKTANTDTIWNTFRRMIWLERDLNDFNQITKKIQSDLCDTESVLFSRLIAALISDKFVNK
jgi:GR25 family glycosyltransferase involved in LPS biosynthesis